KEALEALEKKFSESTKQELKSKLLQEDPRNLIPTQTKAEMSGSQIKRIVKSIKENGFDQEKPVDVWRNPKTGRLEIQDGHHRTEAAKKAGLDKIPVSIWE
ncbi:ParB/Srx family N-terminal domain-containing protein, partial [Pseudomonas aeruginosa]